VETIVMNEQLHQGQRTAGVIRFDRPASVWEEAYPIGNGKLGAMVFGDPRRERLALNEDSVWYAKGNALSGSAWGRACLNDRRGRVARLEGVAAAKSEENDVLERRFRLKRGIGGCRKGKIGVLYV
jgi:hypothetical protein